jgi:DNA-binding helix-hairpin-helix protein with protein kinase domain
LSNYCTGGGNTIKLGRYIGQGGEGIVYSIQNDSNLAAKIYLPHLASERQSKLIAMVSARLYASASFVAYLLDTILDSNGCFCGFTMHMILGHKPAHQLHGPTSRKATFPKATYPMLVRTTTNLARAVHNVHFTGCVIGDLNHSSILVSDDATVVLIDSDSFQFAHRGITYPCVVGMEEFTPPELQGRDLSKIVRTVNHDNFGLAVLVFYTLMMGRHPFAGRYLGRVDMPVDRAIAEYRFAYSARRGATMMEPPPNVPTLADLPLSISDGFERSFSPSGPAGTRPSASEWISILDKAESELIQCSTSSSHHYFRTAKDCPWCRMERAYPGFVAFVTVFPVHAGGKPLDLGQLISAIRATKDPGPVPDLAAIIPAVAGQITNINWAEVKSKRFRRWLGGTIGVGLALFLLTAGPAGPLLALAATVASALIAFLPSSEVKEEQKKLEAAKEAWSVAKHEFAQRAGNSYFLHLRGEADTLIRQLEQLNAEESLRLTELSKKKRELQLHRFLEKHDVYQVKIKGIGDARKLALKSWGIETAADVDYARIVQIPGFGSAVANSVVDWRRQVETRFYFDPNQSVDPADVAAVKTEIGNRRTHLEASAKQTLAKLQKAAADALVARANPGNSALEAWAALKHGEAFEQSFRPSLREAAQLFSVAALCVTSFIVYVDLVQASKGSLWLFPRLASIPPPGASPPTASRPNTPAPGTPVPETSPPAASGPNAPAPSTPAPGASPPTPSGPSAPGATVAPPQIKRQTQNEQSFEGGWVNTHSTAVALLT